MDVLQLLRIAPQNVIEEPDQPHMELLDTTTRQVWQSLRGVDRESYDAFQVEAPYTRVGFGRAAMNEHGFRRSPQAAEDGPMARREFGGRAFVFCAVPESMEMPHGPDGPRLVSVNKHHSLLYRAGRALDFLRRPDGVELVHVIAADPGAPPLKIPDAWSRHTADLESDLVVHLPCPTSVYFFPNGDSFQGPVEGWRDANRPA